MHFVNRNPGLTVADLLDILKITKQSLGRVLKELVDSGYIEQRTGPQDRRQRLLYATPSGQALAREPVGAAGRAHQCRARRARARRARHRGGLPVLHDRPAGAAEGGAACAPERRAMSLPAPARSPESPPDDAAHLLVVDDDMRIRTLLTRFLGSHGFRVTAAASAEEARRQARGDRLRPARRRRDDAGRERAGIHRGAAQDLGGADPHADRPLRDAAPHPRAGGRRRRLSGKALRAARAAAQDHQHPEARLAAGRAGRSR